jgi:hypothetical protein
VRFFAGGGVSGSGKFVSGGLEWVIRMLTAVDVPETRADVSGYWLKSLFSGLWRMS